MFQLLKTNALQSCSHFADYSAMSAMKLIYRDLIQCTKFITVDAAKQTLDPQKVSSSLGVNKGMRYNPTKWELKMIFDMLVISNKM